MLFTRREPCRTCPFRVNAIKGWLGPDTPIEVISKVHGEAGYPCHEDVTNKVEEFGEKEVSYDDVQGCIGAILHANSSCKHYRNPELAAAQERHSKISKAKVLGYKEFVTHHS